MAAIPIFEEVSGSPSSAMIAGLAGLAPEPVDAAEFELGVETRAGRRLAVYPANAGFDMVDELDHLCARTIEPNVFFNPRFLAPAMPRLEDREVRLAVMRDGGEYQSRLRLLMPFSIDRPSIPFGVPVMRTWSSPFGPLGTPLIDRDDPVGVLEDFFTMLSRPHLRFPKVIVFPDLRLEGAAARMLRTAAIGKNLTVLTANEFKRPMLESRLDGEAYLQNSLSSHHVRDYRRLRRRLSEKGELAYAVARSPADIRIEAENFLTLEASGWKGRERTAMAVDRFRAAFVREAVDSLAADDRCRIHTLKLGGKTIASLIVFVEAGVAYTWKTAYDETLSAFSPGTLLMMDATATHLDDPNIERTDSCAVPGHPVMSRLWKEESAMGDVVIGLSPDADRQARQAAAQLHLYAETRNVARLVRDRIRSLIGKN
ncbi:MAG: GNAT family N-acetyltransferase [Rhizobiaceae bacterium]